MLQSASFAVCSTGGEKVPECIVTDKLGSYAAAKERIPELECVKHVCVRAVARLNHRIEEGAIHRIGLENPLSCQSPR